MQATHIFAFYSALYPYRLKVDTEDVENFLALMKQFDTMYCIIHMDRLLYLSWFYNCLLRYNVFFGMFI